MVEYLWAQKYRPRTIEDCILPVSTKELIKGYIQKGEIPHFLFSGPPGCGKTTVAKAIADELDCDLLFLNASMENGIDALRTTVQSFASTVSLSNASAKLVILDEADGLTSLFQSGLKGFLESFGANCRFIFTANHPRKIIDPIHSRCTVVNFKIDSTEKPKLAAQFMKRVLSILESEGIKYDQKAVAALITKSFPDYRSILNELQRYSVSGTIDTGILVNMTDDSFRELFVALKEKKFVDVRKWCGKNADIEDTVLYRKLYDMASTYLDNKSIPQLILLLAEYQSKSSFVADKEINTVACMVEIMASCSFK